jgi:hypothetical protein
LRAFALEPLAHADFVVGAREITDNKAQEMQSFRDLIGSGSRIRSVSADAGRRDAQEPTEEFQPKHFRQAIPFEFRHWRLLKCNI